MLTPGISGITSITQATTPIRLRRPGKLAKTSYANEIAQAVNRGREQPTTGQADDGFGRQLIPCRVVSYTSAGTNQWEYTVTQEVKNTAGYGGWVDSHNGLDEQVAYNRSEENNSGSGRQGNGVDVANLGSCTIQPIPVGTHVDVLPFTLADGTVEYWIMGQPNGVDE